MGVNCSNANLKVVPNIPDINGRGLAFTELYIENNNLTELPAEILLCKNLKKLKSKKNYRGYPSPP